jgi:hypothetical protein
MKILTAYGKKGLVQGTRRTGRDHWNWCNKAEIVSRPYLICDSPASCGCDRSFVGIHSAKSTTKALVVESSFLVVKEALANFHEQTLKGWSQSNEIADKAVCSMMKSILEIQDMQEGSVVELSPDGEIKLLETL